MSTKDALYFDFSVVSYALEDKDDAFVELTKAAAAGWVPVEVFGPPFSDFTHEPQFAASSKSTA